jgi:hypothetical protein
VREDGSWHRHFAHGQLPAVDATHRRNAGRSTRSMHESYEISRGEMLFVTPGALLYAQLDVFVSFQPWKVSWRIDRPFRFESRRLTDGTFQWLHIPKTSRLLKKSLARGIAM